MKIKEIKNEELKMKNEEVAAPDFFIFHSLFLICHFL